MPLNQFIGVVLSYRQSAMSSGRSLSNEQTHTCCVVSGPFELASGVNGEDCLERARKSNRLAIQIAESQNAYKTCLGGRETTLLDRAWHWSLCGKLCAT